MKAHNKRLVTYLEGLLPYFIVFVGVLGVISISAFFGVMFSDNVAGVVSELFGTENKKTETLQFLFVIIGGLAGLFYKLFALNKQATTQDKTNELTERGHDQNRLDAAIEHLSNKESSVRIASFHKLLRLAKDNTDDYAQTVLDILCTHLRKITKYEDIEIYEEVYDHPEEVKILARILFGQETGKLFDGLRFNLRQVNLTGIDFQGMKNPKEVDFSFADLSHAIFNGTNLSGANFSEATLFEAKFVKAILQGAIFPKAALNLADLTGADFSRANMEKAELRYTTCSMTNFYKATLINADFCEADLREAKNLLTANLLLAKHNEGENGTGTGTQFPNGFIPKDDGMDYQLLMQ